MKYARQPIRSGVILNVCYNLHCNQTALMFRLSTLPTYYIPKDGPLQSYRVREFCFYIPVNSISVNFVNLFLNIGISQEYISMLPNIDHPEAFGQHPNADIASQIIETRFVTFVSFKILFL